MIVGDEDKPFDPGVDVSHVELPRPPRNRVRELQESAEELRHIIQRADGKLCDAKGHYVAGYPRLLTDAEYSAYQRKRSLRFLRIPKQFHWACGTADEFRAAPAYARVRVTDRQLSEPRRGPLGIFYQGPMRVGKSSLAAYHFWRSYGGRNVSALWVSALEFEAQHMQREERDALWATAWSATVVMLDDVGSEAKSAFGSGVAELVHRRTEAALETWVTCGVDTFDALCERYSPQVAARMRERRVVVTIGGG